MKQRHDKYGAGDPAARIGRSSGRWGRGSWLVGSAFLLLLGAGVRTQQARGRWGRFGDLTATYQKLKTKIRSWRNASSPVNVRDEALAANTTVLVQLDIAADRHPISPYIYGIAVSSKEMLQELHPALHRWGGNANTRYNWLTNAWNSARDWEFRNHGDDPEKPTIPGKAAADFIEMSHEVNAAVLFTIPTIGWVAKNGNTHIASVGVPAQGNRPLNDPDGAIKGYDPTINRRHTSVRSVARKGRPFVYPPVPQPAEPGDDFTVAQDEFVYFLTRRFGAADKGGVRFYAMDNEPDLWGSTHTDVKPARYGYDDLWRQFQGYATAVKDVDPTAEVTGPVSWGWTSYFYSPLDQGSDNYKTHADREAHGGTPFLLWFLQKAKAYEQRTGKRLLSVLDVHYYPQSNVYNHESDALTAARRIRSVRSLFDPTYSDESWIGEPVRLIPRLKDWIREGYPGTKLGITEWSFGGDNHISGALAIAETLGILGREGVELASYWTTPPRGGPGALAFKLLLNPAGDGKRGMETISCRAVSSDDTHLSVFAATDSEKSVLTVLLVNTTPKATITAIVSAGAARLLLKGASGYRLTADSEGTRARIDAFKPAVDSEKPLALTLSPLSITLLRLPLEKGDK